MVRPALAVDSSAGSWQWAWDPNILCRQPDEILRRFAAGGSGLLLRWQVLLLSAVAMLPLAALLAVVLAASPELTALSIATGAAAALVQAMGLSRWPFAVPELARRYLAAEGPDAAATRRTIEVVFEARAGCLALLEAAAS